MMSPPVFEVSQASPAVVAELGDRVYPFGFVEPVPAYPYAVWQLASGSPGNYLGQVPDVDYFTAQVDVYGKSLESVRAAAQALRDAFEPVAYVVSWRGESRDPDTKNYRFGFDVAWIINR